MSENTIQLQAAQDLRDVKSHYRMVELIVNILCNTEYHLNKLRNPDTEMVYSPATKMHFEHSYKNYLRNDFKFLEIEEHKQYLHTFGAFYRLYNHLKERYETEVLEPNS